MRRMLGRGGCWAGAGGVTRAKARMRGKARGFIGRVLIERRVTVKDQWRAGAIGWVYSPHEKGLASRGDRDISPADGLLSPRDGCGTGAGVWAGDDAGGGGGVVPG